MTKWEERLKLYDELVSKCYRFERKEKAIPYTSAPTKLQRLVGAVKTGRRMSCGLPVHKLHDIPRIIQRTVWMIVSLRREI